MKVVVEQKIFNTKSIEEKVIMVLNIAIIAFYFCKYIYLF